MTELDELHADLKKPSAKPRLKPQSTPTASSIGVVAFPPRTTSGQTSSSVHDAARQGFPLPRSARASLRRADEDVCPFVNRCRLRCKVRSMHALEASGFVPTCHKNPARREASAGRPRVGLPFDIVSADGIAPGACVGITDERGKFSGQRSTAARPRIAIRMISDHAVDDLSRLRDRIQERSPTGSVSCATPMPIGSSSVKPTSCWAYRGPL